MKSIVDENPELYLDEVAVELVERKDCHLSITTISRTLKDKVGYSLQVCYDSALQRNEAERYQYKYALSALVSDAAQCIFIDETHKDRNASRRRKAWGQKHSGGLALKRWFRENVRYTLL